MKKFLLPSLKLTLLSLILLSGIYTLVVLGIAKLVPGHGQGEMITANGKSYYANVGQKVTEDKYFWSRPSAVDYNAAGSGGSNKGPNNPALLQDINARIDTIMMHDPGITKSDIPVDMITASGSGLDPDISVQGAQMQVKRIAAVRHLPEERIDALIIQHMEGPFLGLFGPSKINVLKLNLALDSLK